MFKDTKAFSGFSVDDVPAAKKFYGETLGLNVVEEHGMLGLQIAGGAEIMVYPKDEPTSRRRSPSSTSRSTTSTRRSTS